MALPDFAKYNWGTPIVVADATDYDANVAVVNDLGDQTVQIDCTSLVAGSAQQSTQIDFGAASANLDLEYIVEGIVEFLSACTDGDVVNLYMAWSPSATAANLNPAGITGVDGVYTGLTTSTLAESLAGLDFLGSIICLNNILNKDLNIATISPAQRYGSLVVVNDATPNFVADANEIGFAFRPKILTIQDT